MTSPTETHATYVHTLGPWRVHPAFMDNREKKVRGSSAGTLTHTLVTSCLAYRPPGPERRYSQAMAVLSTTPRVITADGYDVQVWRSLDAVTAQLCRPSDAGQAWMEDGRLVTFLGASDRPPTGALVSDDVAAGDLETVLWAFLQHIATKYHEPSMADGVGSATLRELVDRVAAWESPTRRHRKDSLRNRIAWYVLFRRR